MEILVLDTSFGSVGVLDAYESLIWTEKYNGAGQFEIYTNMDLSLLNILKENYYLGIAESTSKMIIESIQIKTNIESGNKLVVSGRSLESILDRRIRWNQLQASGSIQSIISTLISDGFINPNGTLGATQRKVPNFVFSTSTDPAVTAATISNIQFAASDIIYDDVVYLCNKASLGFRIILNDSNQFVFSLYSGVNRSYSQSTNPYVVFSNSFDNLIDSNYIESNRNLKIWALVFGHETDDGQLYRVVASGVGQWSPYAGLQHREIYIDASHISRFVEGTTTPISDSVYRDQITKYGEFVLKSEHAKTTTFDASVDPNISFKYGSDYFLGDIVQIENEYGIQAAARITEVTRSVNASGVGVYPTLEMI